jgi:hypothetical protein
MFTLEGPHIVMSKTDGQNGLDFHFKDIVPYRNIQKHLTYTGFYQEIM